MPKFFFWSKDGDANFVAMRLQREGHEVRVHIHNKESKDVGRGLVNLVNTRDPRKDEVVFFDMTGFGREADRLRRAGYKVISGGSFGDRMEQDRAFGMQIARDAGMSMPETKDFSNLREARSFLAGRPQDEEWYFKPSGDEECASTRPGRDIPDLLRHFDYLVRSHQVPKAFILQKKMQSTAELSFEGWFDGRKWVLPWNSTIEDKKFLAGNLGPNTGCMSNLVWAYEDQMPLLALRTLSRLTPILRAAGVVCMVDGNFIFDEKGTPNFLEWTIRPGYLALQALMALIGGDLGTQLWEFANGTLDRFDVDEKKFALAIGVSIPPYPNTEFAAAARGIALDPKLLRDPLRILPTDIMVINGIPYVTGSDANVACFVDTGDSIADLRRELLEKIEGYAIPHAQYRVDPVERAEEELEALRSWGYEVPSEKMVEYRPTVEIPTVVGSKAFKSSAEGANGGGVSPNLTHSEDTSGGAPTF